MKSHITMLTGETPSTKHYAIDKESDTVTKSKVKMGYLYDSQVIEVNNIDDLYLAIDYVRDNDCSYIIRGRTESDTQHKIRRTLTTNGTDPNFMEVGTAWLCCDFDRYEVPAELRHTSLEAIEYLIKTILPKCFHNVSYVYQWSARRS